MAQNNRHYSRAEALEQASAKPVQTIHNIVAADLATPQAQREQRDLRSRNMLLTLPYLSVEGGTIKLNSPTTLPSTAGSSAKPFSMPFVGTPKENNEIFPLLKAAADFATSPTSAQSTDQFREKLMNSPYLSVEDGTLKLTNPATVPTTVGSSSKPFSMPFVGTPKEVNDVFPLLKAAADFATSPTSAQSTDQFREKLLNLPYATVEDGTLKLTNSETAAGAASGMSQPSTELIGITPEENSNIIDALNELADYEASQAAQASAYDKSKTTPLGFAEPGLLAAQQSQEMIKMAPYLHLKGQLDSFQPSKEQLPRENIDLVAAYDNLIRRIEYLQLNSGREDANGLIQNNTAELQRLMNIRDKIRESIKPLVDMGGKGYNGNWDPAFDSLVDSLVKESKQGETVLDGIQTVLDGAGLVPGFGEVADGLSALISFLRGNYGEAGLSLLSMLPIAGWLSTASKYAKKAIKGADAIGTAAKHSDEFVDAGEAVAKYYDEATDAGDSALKNIDDQIEQNWYNPVAPDLTGGAQKPFAEGAGETFTQGAKIPDVYLQTKPLNSPAVNRWLEGGGKIEINENGTWKYTNSKGISVTYKNSYPDFKGSGHVKQEIDIGPFKNRSSDFRLADRTAFNGSISPDSTWHHHEDGRTLQEVNKEIHRDFTHRGGISSMKK